MARDEAAQGSDVRSESGANLVESTKVDDLKPAKIDEERMGMCDPCGTSAQGDCDQLGVNLVGVTPERQTAEGFIRAEDGGAAARDVRANWVFDVTSERVRRTQRSYGQRPCLRPSHTQSDSFRSPLFDADCRQFPQRSTTEKRNLRREFPNTDDMGPIIHAPSNLCEPTELVGERTEQARSTGHRGDGSRAIAAVTPSLLA